jgi:hypothetical protein
MCPTRLRLIGVPVAPTEPVSLAEQSFWRNKFFGGAGLFAVLHMALLWSANVNETYSYKHCTPTE